MPRRWGVWRAWGRTVGTAAGAWFVRPESSRTSRSEARRASRAARWRTAPACTVGTARSVWSVVRGARWTPRVVRARCVATGSSAPTAACAMCARLGRSHTTRSAGSCPLIMELSGVKAVLYLVLDITVLLAEYVHCVVLVRSRA